MTKHYLTLLVVLVITGCTRNNSIDPGKEEKQITIEPRSKDFKGEKTSKNQEFVTYVAKNNVIQTIENIRSNSPILLLWNVLYFIFIAGS